MKKFLVFVVMLLVVVGVALVVTCPSREAHREAIRKVATAVVNTVRWRGFASRQNL